MGTGITGMHARTTVASAHKAVLLEGPIMVDTHSYMLSPLGPAEQLQGGSKLISASSF